MSNQQAAYIIQGVFLGGYNFEHTYLCQFLADFKNLGHCRKVLWCATCLFLEIVIRIKIVDAMAKKSENLVLAALVTL